MPTELTADGGTQRATPSAPSQTPEPALASLIGGIVNDGQKLISQHIQLLHHELHEDFNKTKAAMIPIGASFGLGATGMTLLVACLVGFLSWAVPSVPWWGWCGILGAVFGVAAGILYSAGAAKLSSFNPLPDESAGAVQESVNKIANRLS